MTNFDVWSEKYEKELDVDLRIGGERHAYFSEFKAVWIKKFLYSIHHADHDIKVLDAGCGIGGLNKYLRRHISGAAYYGIDISKKSVQKAYRDNGGLQRSYYSYYDGVNVPFKENSFHAAILAGVLHHIVPEGRQEVIDGICKALKPGGFLFIFEHNRLNPVVRHIVKNCAIDKEAKLVAVKDITGILIKSGFELIKKNYIIFFPRCFNKLRFLEPKLSGLPLGAQYVLVGRKSLKKK